jgi:hypothetical protein
LRDYIKPEVNDVNTSSPRGDVPSIRVRKAIIQITQRPLTLSDKKIQDALGQGEFGFKPHHQNPMGVVIDGVAAEQEATYSQQPPL